MSNKCVNSILLVEDDQIVRELYKKFLEVHGFHIIDAKDGIDGVNKFSERQYSIKLLILDVILPKKNGYDAMKEIKRINSNINTIFVSGYDSEVAKKIHTEGYCFLKKPFHPNVLLNKIRELLV
jgi:DNA-binding response OmpR family regulator